MKTSEKSFILVTEPSGTIIVDNYLEELLRKEMRPILWYRDGLFSVVPEAVLMNILDDIGMEMSAMILRGKVHWSQTYHIDDEAGRSLISL